MSAFRIFSRFADLLDINVTRAAAAWLRLNADGTVTERTAAQTLTDLSLGRLTVSSPASMPIGWIDNGDETYTANLASGFAYPEFPVAGLVAGGVYVTTIQYVAVTSGGLQHPGYNLNDPGTSASGIGSNGASAGNFRSSICVWQPGFFPAVTARPNNGFVGTIRKPVVVRIG
jgi:hypothetical protein